MIRTSDIQGNYGEFIRPSQINKGEGISSSSFGDTLNEFMTNVDKQLKESDRLTEDFAMGKNNNIHEVMIASEKAGISLKFLLQVRNKLLDAYQEIMRMSF